MMKNKKGLLRHGHKILSVLALIMAYLIANYVLKIPVMDIILKYPLFTIGGFIVYFFVTALVDKIEKGGYNHRSILHSKVMVVCCIISIPFTIKKSLEESPYWFFVTIAIISHLLHLFYDSLSKPLPKFF